MLKNKVIAKRLSLGRETVRKLTSVELRNAQGGSEPITGPIDVCVPMSPYNACTGCTIGSQEPCGTGWCGSGGNSFDCTLATFVKK